MARNPSSHPDQDTSAANADPGDIQMAAMGNLMGMSTAWMESLGDMGAEVADFVADRIKEDVKTQHEFMRCKDLADIQRVQARFVEKAIAQYQAETGKLMQMSVASFVPKAGNDS